jgi:hypothetical protein
MDATLRELELQQELERFTTQFTDRVTQATENLERVAEPHARDEALRKNLLYVSSAVEIATGPFPEVNLLDMMVFVRLSRAVLEKHWIPELYGKDGMELAEVFARSEEELCRVADHVLSAAQRLELAEAVNGWRRDNAQQVRVEGIRLADFSSAAGSAAAERGAHAKGLLASMKTAASVANQALLLSERTLFLFHRLPSLWRLQARLGAREMLSDAMVQLTKGSESPLARVTRRAHRLAGRALLYVAMLGALGLFIWWLSWNLS